MTAPLRRSSSRRAGGTGERYCWMAMSRACSSGSMTARQCSQSFLRSVSTGRKERGLAAFRKSSTILFNLSLSPIMTSRSFAIFSLVSESGSFATRRSVRSAFMIMEFRGLPSSWATPAVRRRMVSSLEFRSLSSAVESSLETSVKMMMATGGSGSPLLSWSGTILILSLSFRG